MPGPDAQVTDADAAAVARATALADEVLFPSAPGVERCDVVPAARLDLLADAGLYGLAGPAEAGGLGCTPAGAAAVVEALAGGCLTTTFVWMQHHGAVRAVAAADDAALRADWLGDLCRGRVRAGIVFAGLIPGPPRLTATAVDGGVRLDGTADWVSGWGRVDVLLVLARDADDRLVSLLVDAGDRPGLHVERQRLVAVDASATVRLHLDGVVVPADRVVSAVPFDPAAGSTAAALRTNGSLALGVAGRACRLLGADAPGRAALVAQLDRCRAALDAADDATMPDARAAASAFAVRATTALVVDAGARGILDDAQAQRLAREALVLLVFGSRPGISAALAGRLAAGGDATG